jgi:hypothetical protein
LQSGPVTQLQRNRSKPSLGAKACPVRQSPTQNRTNGTCIPLPPPSSAPRPSRGPSSILFVSFRHPRRRRVSPTARPTTPPSSPRSSGSAATPITRSTQVLTEPIRRGHAGSCTHGSCASACPSGAASATRSSTCTAGPAAWATPGARWAAAPGLQRQARRRARCCPATRGRGPLGTFSMRSSVSGVPLAARQTSLALQWFCPRVRGWVLSSTAGRCTVTC